MKPVRAMTLVEILAVVVILGLITVTLTVGLSGRVGKAKHSLARTQIGQIVSQVATFQLDKKRYPSASDGLQVLTKPLAQPTDAFFLDPAQILDPWGRAYLYVIPGPDGHPFEVLTYGADGQQGGTGENADLSSSNLKDD